MSAQTIYDLVLFNKENSTFIVSIIQTLSFIIYSFTIFWFIRDVNKLVENKRLRTLLYTLLGAIIIPSTIGYIFIDKSFVFFNLLSFVLLISYSLIKPSKHNDNSGSQLYNKNDLVLIENDLINCKKCNSINKKDFKFCVQCGEDLISRCTQCEYSTDPTWSFCPNCKFDLNIIDKKKNMKIELPKLNLKPIIVKLRIFIKKLKKNMKIELEFEPTKVMYEKKTNPSFEMKMSPEELKTKTSNQNSNNKHKKKKKKKKRY